MAQPKKNPPLDAETRGNKSPDTHPVHRTEQEEDELERKREEKIVADPEGARRHIQTPAA